MIKPKSIIEPQLSCHLFKTDLQVNVQVGQMQAGALMAYHG